METYTKTKLRDYQNQAVHDAFEHIKISTEPCLIEAFTAAGKSLIVAELAKKIHEFSGKKVLCLQPSKELCQQNIEKYLATGNQCSIFSASLGTKCIKHNVVYGTPKTVANKIHRFGNQFGAIILDEAHESLTPTIFNIIDSIKKHNPNLRVIGLTSTPFKLGLGYIYKIDLNDKPIHEDIAKNPYFYKLVCQISGRYLLEHGYITKPVIGAINSCSYDTSKLKLNSFDEKTIDAAFVGHGRETSLIVSDVVNQSVNRSSIMLFGATIRHCEEILASLPPIISAMITGKTNKKEREQIILDFKAQNIKYLVSVDTLTTGFDCTSVDVIALLRKTESSALLGQIIGRSVRIHEGKKDSLILDYAQNIDMHFPDGDLFNPEIKSVFKSEGELSPIISECPECKCTNEFSAKKNDEKFNINKHGYFIDLEGNEIETEYGAMPGHWGRRCQGYTLIKGKYSQCVYRYTHKLCEVCESENDITARYCSCCKHELINPNDRLVADFQARKKDPHNMQTDKVVDMKVRPTISKAGNECLKVDFITEYRSFPIWFTKKITAPYNEFMAQTIGGNIKPNTITYKKKGEFFTIYGYNKVADEIPS
jgi:DNA repair protein RadD